MDKPAKLITGMCTSPGFRITSVDLTYVDGKKEDNIHPDPVDWDRGVTDVAFRGVVGGEAMFASGYYGPPKVQFLTKER